jgi:integrase
MGVYKRGKIYWYKFKWEGRTVRESTKQGNKTAAGTMEAAHKTRLALGDVGIEDKTVIPTLRGFSTRFFEEIQIRRAEKPRTIEFYETKMTALLAFEKIASARLDRIDENMISEFVRHERKVRKVAIATVNRELSTLKRALRLALRWRIIKAVPYIEMLDGEKQNNFVLSEEDETSWLDGCDRWLRHIEAFLLETGLRVSELAALRWEYVHFEPLGRKAKRGWIHVDDGKTRHAVRNLSITERARQILLAQKAISKCEYVFPLMKDPEKNIAGERVTRHHATQKKLMGWDEVKYEDFTPHSLRHTFLTRLGAAGADAFTIMRIAGHSSITVSQRYVHPTAGTIEAAFDRLEEMYPMAVNSGIHAGAQSDDEIVKPANKSVRGGTKGGTRGKLVVMPSSK